MTVGSFYCNMICCYIYTTSKELGLGVSFELLLYLFRISRFHAPDIADNPDI